MPALCGPGKVLVRVKAAALNPIDYKLPMLMVNGNVIGQDVAGEVVESTSALFNVGDEILGNSNNGSMAEFVVCEEDSITHKPRQLSWSQAASIGVTYVCRSPWIEREW